MFGNALPKRATRDNADRFIAQRVNFKTGGALSGEIRNSGFAPHKGYLPEKYWASVNSADYIVWSYATPIAWWSEEDGWTIPDVSYSVTTSRHQSKAALGAHYSGDKRVNGTEKD